MGFLLTIAVLIVYFVICKWIALLTNNILINKGYNSNYWLGFFFGIFAWIYCIALPDLKIQKAIQEMTEKNKEE